MWPWLHRAVTHLDLLPGCHVGCSALVVTGQGNTIGVWRSWLARTAGGREVAGSSPVTPTKFIMSTLETIAIIPAYNEEKTVGDVARAALQARLIDGVIVVDDGSSDTTHEIACNVVSRLGEQQDAEKPFIVLSHPENLGKTDALRTGIDRARELGGSSLSTLVFLDADSSPIWTRDTSSNMKLWQVAIHKVSGRDNNLISSETLAGRQDAFMTLLARYIDEITEPIKDGKEVMRTGMYQRNVVTDTILAILDKSSKGGHAGNRALPLSVWDGFEEECFERGISIHGWSVEAALNEYVSDQPTGTFMMYGVVNVGSRVKAGGFWRGLGRMAEIHGQMPFTKRKFAR